MKSLKNKSKILLLIVGVLFSYQSLFSQCKLERIKDDFGEGETVYSNEVSLKKVFPLIGSKEPWELVMNFMLVKGVPTILVNHKSQSYSSSLKSIYFSFKDGSVIKKETPSSVSSYNTGFGYEYELTNFILSKEEIEMFATKDLLKFQVDFRYFPDYPLVEDDIKSKNAEKLKKDAVCMVTEFDLALKSMESKKAETMNKIVDYKCSYEVDNTDPFTKKRNLLTNSVMMLDTMWGSAVYRFYVAAGNTNGVNQFKFFAQLAFKGVGDAVKKYLLFDQVDIMLENDDVISLKTNEISEFTISNINAWAYKQFAIEDDLTWRKLKSNPIKILRLSLNGKVLNTLEIQKRYTKSITNVISCSDELGIPKSK